MSDGKRGYFSSPACPPASRPCARGGIGRGSQGSRHAAQRRKAAPNSGAEASFSFGKLLDVTDNAAIAPLMRKSRQRSVPSTFWSTTPATATRGCRGPRSPTCGGSSRSMFSARWLSSRRCCYMRNGARGTSSTSPPWAGSSPCRAFRSITRSKFCSRRISEASARKSNFGIHADRCRAGWLQDRLGRSLHGPGQNAPSMSYNEVFEPLRARLGYNSKQAGDPKKAARAMLKVVASDNPPAHLLLGRDDQSRARKAGLLKSEFDAWEPVSSSTDFE